MTGMTVKDDVTDVSTRFVLGIDTSCDDTGVGVVAIQPSGKLEVRSNCIWSQVVHAEYGGVMPELASREHLARIRQMTAQALQEANISWAQLHAISATRGPGLMGALLVGLMYGKGLAQALELPLYAVHHLEGHIFAATAAATTTQHTTHAHTEHTHTKTHSPDFPYLALVVSGGHTHLFEVVAHGEYRLVGATRDDAAGEAFDKVARLAGLGYPGGPAVAKAAQNGDPKAIPFKEPLQGQKGFEFSFSGLKTAALLAHKAGASAADLAASFQRIAVFSLVKTTKRAAQALGHHTVVVSGGVAANEELRTAFSALATAEFPIRVLFPPARLNTDNGAMIALAGAAALQENKAPSRLDVGAEAYVPLALS